jgi:DNA uptake protein ComE-like DNA-binding protein
MLAPGVASAQAGRRGDVLDANTASEKQLRSVPGLPPELAKAIVDRRPVLKMTELDAAMGAALSREQRAGLYQHLFVQIDLNTASDEEILLIPGLGPRLLREFKEYRPYRALAQFRREIAKCVDQ